MAANGYIVVAPDRCGLPGFGRAVNDAVSDNWGDQPLCDYLTALDKILKSPYVDKDRRGCSTTLRASYPFEVDALWPTAPKTQPAATLPTWWPKECWSTKAPGGTAPAICSRSYRNSPENETRQSGIILVKVSTSKRKIFFCRQPCPVPPVSPAYSFTESCAPPHRSSFWLPHPVAFAYASAHRCRPCPRRHPVA